MNIRSLLNMHQIDQMQSSATKLATHLARSPKMDIFHILFYQFTYDKRLVRCSNEKSLSMSMMISLLLGKLDRPVWQRSIKITRWPQLAARWRSRFVLRSVRDWPTIFLALNLKSFSLPTFPACLSFRYTSNVVSKRNSASAKCIVFVSAPSLAILSLPFSFRPVYGPLNLASLSFFFTLCRRVPTSYLRGEQRFALLVTDSYPLFLTISPQTDAPVASNLSSQFDDNSLHVSVKSVAKFGSVKNSCKFRMLLVSVGNLP